MGLLKHINAERIKALAKDMGRYGLSPDVPGDLAKYKQLTEGSSFQSGEQVVKSTNHSDHLIEEQRRKVDLIAVAAGKQTNTSVENGSSQKG